MPTLLVIDDDDAFRAFVRAALDGPELRVVEVVDGAQAVDAALAARPDVILLDWRMPGQSGITTCRRIRECRELAGVRIAMVTGLDDERDRTLARHAGADAYVVKDGDPASLVAQIRRLLTSDDVAAGRARG